MEAHTALLVTALDAETPVARLGVAAELDAQREAVE